jgi:cytochrome c-type biogenesis protein CcmH
MKRRVFVAQLVAGAFTASLARALRGQATQTPSSPDSSNLFAMDQTASRPVHLPPKPGSRVVVSAAERDALEHRLRCQCGCTLDVYTCRTTDFSCQVSPAMHRDVMALVQGGYSAQEILDTFVGVYGEQVLMAPPAAGFNLFGWAAPFVVLGGGAVAVVALLRSWRRAPRGASPLAAAPPKSRPGDATDEELARLEAAIRDDE